VLFNLDKDWIRELEPKIMTALPVRALSRLFQAEAATLGMSYSHALTIVRLANTNRLAGQQRFRQRC